MSSSFASSSADPTPASSSSEAASAEVSFEMEPTVEEATVRFDPTSLPSSQGGLDDTVRADEQDDLTATIETNPATDFSDATSEPSFSASSSASASAVAPASTAASALPVSATLPSPPPTAAFAPSTPLPSFASPEAVALDAALHSKRHELYATQSTLEQTRERISIMAQHLQHVQAEYGHARLLLQNKQRDSDSQRHLSALLDREDGRLHQDASALLKKAEANQSALSSLQAQKLRLSDELAAFQSDMNWSNEQLLQWSLASKQKEEDRQMMAEFGRLDQLKVRELRKKVEEVVGAVEAAKAELERVETESAELLMSSEQLSKEYKAAYDKKMRVIAEWEDSVRRMHAGDERLMRLGEEVVDARREVKGWELRVGEVEQFSAEELRQNKRLMAKIDEAERVNGKVRDEWQRQKAAIVEMEEEVVTKRNVMEKLEMDLRQAKHKEHSLHAQRAEREKAVNDFTMRLQQAQAEYKDEVAALQTVANQHEHLTQSLKDTEAKVAFHQQSVVRRKEELYHLSVQLSAERAKEEQGIIEIANAQGTSKALQGKIHSMDIASIKQQEMLYQIEFVIQGLERKVNEASGKRSVEENEQLRVIMEQLKDKREAEEREGQLLDGQLKRLQDDLRGVKRRQEAATAAMKRKEEDVNTLKVEIAAQQRQLTAVQRRVDDLRVSHDKAKLDVLKLRSRLQEEQDGVWEEEKKKVDIRDAIAVRQEEIGRYEEVQRIEVRAEDAERGRLVRELKEKERTLEMLRKKYSTLHAKFVGSEVGREEEEETGEGVEAKSQGYYIVKAGLEREEELRRHSQLLQEQRRVEEEIEGLTRLTLEMEGKAASSTGRLSSAPGAEQAEVERLQCELRSVERDVFELSGKERQQRREVEQRKAVLAGLISSIGAVIAAVRGRQEEAAKLLQVKGQLDAGLKRTTAAVERKVREWRGRRKTGEEEKGGGGPGEAEEELSDALLYVGVQEGKRRWQGMRECMRGFLLEHEELQGECGALVTLLDIDVRPSSAASSIVSHLSEEKEGGEGEGGGGLTGRSVGSESSAGGLGSASRRSTSGGGDVSTAASRKSSAATASRALTGGGSRRSTGDSAERLVIDARTT